MKSINLAVKRLIIAFSMVLTFVAMPINVAAGTIPIGQGDELTLNKVFTIGSSDDQYYTLTVPASGLIQYHVVNGTMQEVEIRDKDNNKLYYDSCAWTSPDVSLYMRGGQYSVRLRSTYSWTELVFYFTSVDESFSETELSNNDTPETASSITNLDGTVYKGLICKSESSDWYKFTVPSKCDVKLILNSITNGKPAAYLLQDANGNYIADKKGNDTYTNTLNAGTYYLRIGKAGYDFVYNFQLKAEASSDINDVTLTNVKPKSAKKGNVSISWNNTADLKVDGYQIAISNKKSFKKTIKSYTSKGKGCFKKITVPKKYRGKKIYFRVRAYSKDSTGRKNYSAWSKTVSIKVKK